MLDFGAPRNDEQRQVNGHKRNARKKTNRDAQLV
jgi:hypothetical protein